MNKRHYEHTLSTTREFIEYLLLFRAFLLVIKVILILSVMGMLA